MDVAALVISVVALILALVVAGFGILLQFLTYRATSEQTGRVSKDLAGFGGDLETMIARLQGQTETMTGVQRDQFNTMLEAFVTKPGAAGEAAEKASESATGLREVLERLESLEGRISEYPDVDRLGEELRAIRQRVDVVAETASAAARLADQVSRPATPGVSYGMMHVGVETFGRYPVDVVDLLKEVDSITRSNRLPERSKLEEWHTSKVMSPSAALAAALRDDLVSLESDNQGRSWLSLTKKGSRLLSAVKAGAWSEIG